jgi:acetyl-CoA acetyltransferase
MLVGKGAAAMEQAIKDKTAIAGIGWTAFSKNSGTSVANLAAEASLKAIDDAGLSPKDIDGIVSYFYGSDTFDVREVPPILGLDHVNFSVFDGLGGLWSCGAVASAAMAVFAGVCTNVLVYRAMNGRSERRPRDPAAHAASGMKQWTLPAGVNHAADTFGLPYVAHMARYGMTTLDLAHLAVAQRRHAMLNEKAMMRAPLTVEEHQASPWVTYPYRLLDCCLQTDGAAAIVVTSAERARGMRHKPVYISSIMGGAVAGDRPWEINAHKAAPRLYEGAGITASDVDIAELYDPFTGMCLLHMEGFALVEPGGSGAAVRAGETGLDGRIPVNTHGGLLSEAYVQGLNHVVEAVQQLRPGGVVDDLCTGEHDYDRTHCRQVKDPHVALVCGECGDTSLILRNE